MQSSLTQAIRKRARAEGERRDHPDGFPLLPALPAARYSDPALFELEREHVFGTSWLLVAHDSELAEVGDVLLFELLPAPVILVRGRDFEVRAFYNACPHRGGPLTLEAKRNAGTQLACLYHGWSFDLEGRLRGIPDSRDYPHVERSCHGLRAVRCERWGHLIFINLDADARPLHESLGVIARDVDDEIGDAVHGGGAELVHRREMDLACNWKLPTEANIESYHVNVVHRETGARILQQQATGMWLLPGGHSRMFVSNQEGIPHAASPLPALPHVTEIGAEGIYSYLAFPNLILSLSPSLVFAVTTWPLAPNRCRYVVHTMGVDRGEQTRDAWEEMIGFLWQTLEEDLGILEMMQRSLDAGVLQDLVHGYQERRIYYLHEEIDRRVGVERVSEALRVQPLLERWVEE